MFELANKQVLVAGLGSSGQAACRLLLQRQARVMAIDQAKSKALTMTAEALRALGARVELGVSAAPDEPWDLVVLSPGISVTSPLLKALIARGVPVIGELELGYQQSKCLNVSITGTNGKTTTTELVERILRGSHRKTVAAGNIGLPLCAVAESSADLDWLTLEVSSFQLETIRFFRPAVAVLMNITPDHLDRHPTLEGYIRAKARLFENQQAFDWAIVQSEALAQLQFLNIALPGKVITFSAQDRQADLHLDRGLILSKIHDWQGPIFDMDQSQIKGPHNAENVMAALAVGKTLRLPLNEMVEAIKSYEPAPHRCERVAEIEGVLFVNDSKATNIDAVAKALAAMPGHVPGFPHVLLIAGGKDKGLPYHDLGPMLAERVKHAFLLGETQPQLRAAWSLFTPCTAVDSLVQAVQMAFANAEPGDVVLLSPACSSFDMFQNYQHRGDVFRQAVRALPPRTSPLSHGGERDAFSNSQSLCAH